MRLYDQVLSEEDFERLPPALRRKVSDSFDFLCSVQTSAYTDHLQQQAST